MKAVIIYYSFTGNTKKVTGVLSEFLKQKYNEVKIFRLEAPEEAEVFFTQEVRAFFRKKTQLSPVDYDLSDYDLICLGGPVWAFAPVPAMNTYLERCFGFEGKPIVLFTTHGSGIGVSRCHEYIERVLTKKGAKAFSRFSIQQSKVNNKEFINKVISENL